jgi:acyl dehydratase
MDMAGTDWITETTLRVAADTGLDPSTLLVDETVAERLLDLAGYAAHSSGERTNAPLLCFVLGRAAALGAPLDALEASVRDVSGS